MTNYLEEGIRELVEEFIASGKPCPSKQTITERRAGYLASTALAGSSPEMAQEFIDELDGIQVKVYKPFERANLPITVYFHGGCFVSGGFETHDIQLRQLAHLSATIVICIKYRLAPEHIYPTAHDDVYRAVLRIKEQGNRYGGNTEQICFVGDSAGGQLALATSFRLKNQKLWLPAIQILLYPMLDPLGKSDSYQQNGTDFIITAQMLLSGFQLYAGDAERLTNEPELNLLARHDFQGLPPTRLITAEFDPLRDEVAQLHQLLLSHGVEAYCEHYSGVIHGFFQLSGVSQSARRCIQNVASVIKNSTRISD
ncbi:alpha/beta hydrolase [Celerinatantimonas diazotrophica]|uniref:Acetyl esterase n=1 Tax=Celerinatantimonas diazotrophica TaxID=412034 RepID=A0A4R1JL99_9GAMM|nr:alpha/beta hydrolase [Celerinatantimonas diazotrophica]TCK51828.1 acetyl esterase [Celerinatantimonas diazotrophica]CAG9296480.1 Carboxylesterase NlhH [Celerinatantimonas diazotrophica]